MIRTTAHFHGVASARIMRKITSETQWTEIILMPASGPSCSITLFSDTGDVEIIDETPKPEEPADG